MRVLIGIDDTDNLETRGTGFRARHLGALLATEGLGRIHGITRHQLLVDPRIPYTSHNSSACLLVERSEGEWAALVETCRRYLLQVSAPGSDPGLCITPLDRAGASVRNFGELAKDQVLTSIDAFELAQREGLVLEGLAGTGAGVIGALAAVGLRAGGNDGRFLWLPGIRNVRGVYTPGQLYEATGIEEIRRLDGIAVPFDARIALSEWTRPVLREGRAILLVEEAHGEDQYEWQVLARDVVKQFAR
ncbi:MAG TPA: hypothetical protein DEP84_21185 [Chloroflexi bacterium]|nr:hypothetical protein [Chloroflexota bacterium]